jgi:hypothetical protein
MHNENHTKNEQHSADVEDERFAVDREYYDPEHYEITEEEYVEGRRWCIGQSEIDRAVLEADATGEMSKIEECGAYEYYNVLTKEYDLSPKKASELVCEEVRE